MVEYTPVACPECGTRVEVALEVVRVDLGGGRMTVTAAGRAEHTCGRPAEVTGR
jgi:uncharacterized protein (UPF0212 family)